MNKKIIIMCPTVQRAIFEWKAFLTRWATIIKKANRARLYIELLSGHEIYFKGETEGQRALLGLRADIVTIDEFLNEQKGEKNDDFRSIK